VWIEKLNVCRWVSKSPSTPVASGDDTLDTIGIPEHRIGEFDLSTLQCSADFRTTDGFTVEGNWIDTLDRVPKFFTQAAQKVFVPSPVFSETMIVTDNQMFGTYAFKEYIPHELFRWRLGKLESKGHNNQYVDSKLR
jgi:hypothetical protein